MRKYLSINGLIFIFLFGIGLNKTFGQTGFFKKLFSGGQDTTRSNSFIPLPILSYSKETGIVFGATGLYSFYIDPADINNRNSTLSVDADYSTEKQATVFIKTDIWGIDNRNHFAGDIRYKLFPFYFYGIGNQTREQDKDLVVEHMQNIILSFERRFGHIYYTGLDFVLNNYDFKAKTPGGTFDNYPNLDDRYGGQSLFIGVSQSIDTRNSNVYATKGILAKAGIMYSPTFEGTLLRCDLRYFKSLNPKLVLGLNANFQSIQGTSIPYYLLPQLGNELIMRGYYTGRYREQNLLAAQTEIRYRFSRRLGVVGFVGLGNVYKNGEFQLAGLKPTYGAGARYFFEAERGLSLSLDYGFGEKRAGENRQQNLYIGLGQSF